MKVILLKDIAKLGRRGEVKEVADAYAINVLMRKGDAIQATSGELAKWKAKEDAKERKKETNLNTFFALVDALRKTEVIIKDKKRDDKGQLFAHIRETDVADAIFAAVKLSVNPKQLTLPKVIKSIGSFEAEVKEGEKKEVFLVKVI